MADTNSPTENASGMVQLPGAVEDPVYRRAAELFAEEPLGLNQEFPL
jgi:hypothetical protein